MRSSQQQLPPPSFPQPYATHRYSNSAQNEARDSVRPQDGFPPGHGYPPLHNASVPPSQVYSSPQALPPSSRRSTYSTAPTQGYAPSFPRQPDPQPSGSISHYQPFPEGYASVSSSGPPPPMTHRASTIPMPVHPNIAPPMPYGMSPHPPSRLNMSGGPQPSQSGSYRMDESSNFSSGDLGQRLEDRSGMQEKSPPSFPFAQFAAGRKSHGKHPGKPSSSSSAAPDKFPCRLCGKLTPRQVIEYWHGFCCERHKAQWIAENQP